MINQRLDFSGDLFLALTRLTSSPLRLIYQNGSHCQVPRPQINFCNPKIGTCSKSTHNKTFDGRLPLEVQDRGIYDKRIRKDTFLFQASLKEKKSIRCVRFELRIPQTERTLEKEQNEPMHDTICSDEAIDWKHKNLHCTYATVIIDQRLLCISWLNFYRKAEKMPRFTV